MMPPHTTPPPTALIAEDEPLLAAALRAELAQVWPALQVLTTVGDGLSAVTQALALQPDVLFLDIRMPGQTGLEAAAELADAWPARGARPFPALVFVTAYDQYACQAFDLQAVDYVLKPVQRHRLQQTVDRLRATHSSTSGNAGHSASAPQAPSGPTAEQLAQLAALLAQTTPTPSTIPSRLQWIPASVSSAQGASLVMVPVAEVLYFEAADKYVRVLTAEREVLIRTPLKELLPQLDPDRFWQVHRGTVVQAEAIEHITRDEAGKLWLHLRQRPERLAVSRLYAHLFKAM
jgi:DNA-binding LytR/AlgR family response regulator